jgi:formate hydrogenlyase subunit 3/multisubunit Na+/H+ antiporter MnhD subunit
VNASLLILTWLAPLLAAPFVLLRNSGRWLLTLASLPALLTALLIPTGTQLEISWLLLGSHFGLDARAEVFLLFTALLWLIAGLQSSLTMQDDIQAGRFRLFFLLAMAGNFWLIVSQDLVNFYLGFALMGLAAYGLVIHNGDKASLRAGRVYLVMTLVAEVALFAAFVFISQHTETLVPRPEELTGLNDWAIGLLVLGLGIKAGLVLLHIWLPLAHPAAPVPASAVLSGTMIKAALIGWMRFLPLGQEALMGWGNLLIIAGAITVLYAIPVGLVQTNPKVVLAYSSVGKMGLMTAILGLALLAPPLTPAILTALIFYAAHHGLAKGALFLGVGIVRSSNALWPVLLLAVPAMVLAGAPYTSGAFAKAQIMPQFTNVEGPWADFMPVLLSASTIGTTLLMARFLTLMKMARSGAANARPWFAVPWLVLIGIILAMPLVTGLSVPSVGDSWPLLLGAILALLAVVLRPKFFGDLSGRIPAGDVLEPVLRFRYWLGDYSTGRLQWPLNAVEVTPRHAQWLKKRLSWSLSLEKTLSLLPVAGALLLGIGGTLFMLLWTPT